MSMKGLTFLAFLFSLGKGKSETEHIPTGEQQKLEGNRPKAPFQCSAVHIQHHCLFSDVQPQKNAEVMRLPSSWLKVASLNLSKFIFLLVYFLWYELLLTSQLSKHPPVDRYSLSFSLAAAETMARSELGREDPSSPGTWGELRQWTASLLSCSMYFLAATKSLSIVNGHEENFYEGRYYHSLGGWMWSRVCIQLSEETASCKHKVGWLKVSRLVLAICFDSGNSCFAWLR